jgi:acetolactate decarboxylase
MKMKIRSFLLISLIFSGCAHAPCQKNTVFQNAPINSLLAGCYTGSMSVRGLKEHGDFGIGTLDALDGEMIALDGVFYQIKPDGRASRLDDKAMSPFATVTFFKAGQQFSPQQGMAYKDLTRFLDENLASANLFYAIKIEGRFPEIKVRSAPRQERPYPVLTEAIRGQKVFELKDQEGTLVGFRCPPYASGINVTGYHFHFLSKDKKIGGHVMDLRIADARIQTDPLRRFSMEVPGNEEFLKFQYGANSEQALEKIEK